MPNPFRSKPGSKKLNDPVSVCPVTKAEIRVEVYSFDPRNVGNRKPIDGVGLTVTGVTATKPAITPAGGQWRFQPLAPGAYTVTPGFTAEQNERYDTTVPTAAAVNQDLVAAQVAAVVILVPSTWVEYFLRDTAAAPRLLPNVPWILERQPLGGGGYTRYDAGKTDATGQVLRLAVRTGSHRLTVRELTNPAWSAPEAVIGTPVNLTADVLGFSAGETGVFEILSAVDLAAVLLSVPGTVKASPGGLQFQATWKPVEGPFAGLKRSQIVFRAKASDAVVYSAPVMLKKKETLKFATTKGTAVNRQVTLRFSSGHSQTVTTAKGEAEVLAPWAEALLAVDFPALTDARVKVEGLQAEGTIRL